MAPALPDSCRHLALLEALQQSSQPGLYAKEQLALGQQQLDDAFADTPIDELITRRAQLVDEVLLAAWSLFALDEEDSLSLVAVGGYGRRELHPASDVDLLLLTAKEPEAGDPLRGKLESLIAFLWDSGLEIGHSVRTLRHCADLARDDITVASNIMEARTLAGSDDLLIELVELTAPDHMWPVDAFFSAKRDEQKARHAKFNDTEFSLEPDIKKAPGGLRDLHTICWVTRRYFQSESLEQLVDFGFLSQRELSYLLRSRELLWRIRWVLHRLTDRNENRLLFDYQREVARQLGYSGDDANLAVEHFMKDYYRSALALSVLNGLALQLFDEAILQHGEEQRVYPLNRHFQVRNDYLEAVSDDLFKQYPAALLEAFLLMARHDDIKGIRAVTIRRMFAARHRIDDDFREDPVYTETFMALLRSPGDLHQQLLAMKRYGILAQYLPEFGRIVGMMQYDLFHRYTVDAHTLLLLKNIRSFYHADQEQPLPLASRVIYRLPKPELLYVAGLYHDIAKGRGGDHSQLGAADAEDFCRRHRLSRWDTQLVIWLVKNHLLMSVTAQRKDISDPEVVHDFARQVGDLVHLDYLYVLTVADIRATDPKLWNSWRATLLLQLHQDTARALRRGLNNPINKQDWIDDTRDNAAQRLEERGFDKLKVASLLTSLGDEYFLRETADDIIWHAEAILTHQAESADRLERPLVLARQLDNVELRGGTQLFIYTPDSKNLFAATVNELNHLGLTIADARIITSGNGFSLDTYVVHDEQGTSIANDQARLKHICQQLESSLHHPEQFGELVARQLPRRHRHFDVPTQVVISNDLRNDCTLVDIEALDHPGLLAHIGHIFTRFNLLVQNARIATFGERAEDIFLVTDENDRPLSDPAVGDALRQSLIEELDNLPNKKGTRK